ncbi:glycine cleavage system protein GcvH [Candidatus Bathyarchaeota archaeon]|nr:glycine cleavage system protein GcvH [Candidatus Bathyarchaeota archaeon]
MPNTESQKSSFKVNEYEIRTDRFYTKEHEWVLIEKDGKARVGITDYAQKSLHDIVYVETLEIGSTVRQMESLGNVESIKSVSEIFAPLSGKIIEINEKLTEEPELINKSPYDEGWIVIIDPSAPDEEIENLLTPEEYGKLIDNILKGKK